MTTLRVRELAEARGFNILTLSRASELSYTTVHNMWHGTMKQLNMETLNSVALALGVEVSDLFAGKPERSVKQKRAAVSSGQHEAVLPALV